jgi:hypothetical protein
MLNLIYLPTGERVNVPGEKTYSRADFERYIKEDAVYFYRHQAVFGNVIKWAIEGNFFSPSHKVIPKYLFEVVEVPDV